MVAMKNGASNLLMIRPVAFGFNAETAQTNTFQNAEFGTKNKETAQEVALQEFDNFVAKLRAAGIRVLVWQDSPSPHTPDSIFPNNWVSFHENGTVVLYPMQAVNRRLERRMDLIDEIGKQFLVSEIVDLSAFEQQDKFLEGTGSMVLDRDNHLAYACLSPRTHREVLAAFGQKLGYDMVAFEALDENGGQIYHTNVLMCVAKHYVVICLDALPNTAERNLVMKTIQKSGKRIIDISHQQMNQFAGNMLELYNSEGQSILVMSTAAYNSLHPDQIKQIEGFSSILHSDLQMIEGNGGGSARCMMAEIHLPLR